MLRLQMQLNLAYAIVVSHFQNDLIKTHEAVRKEISRIAMTFHFAVAEDIHRFNYLFIIIHFPSRLIKVQIYF